jgi:hypothetical protein
MIQRQKENNQMIKRPNIICPFILTFASSVLFFWPLYHLVLFFWPLYLLYFSFGLCIIWSFSFGLCIICPFLLAFVSSGRFLLAKGQMIKRQKEKDR